MTETKQPERLCVGCRQLHPKSELLRIVRTAEGAAAYDPTGKSPGRGAYLCHSSECLRLARKHNGLSWSFKGRVTPAVYDALEDVVRREEDGA
mgnify:FL=1